MLATPRHTMHRIFCAGGLALILSATAQANLVLNNWDFNETAGTGIEATANNGSAATSGAPTWGAPSNNNSGDWATTGGGSMQITGNNSSPSTLAQSVVTMPGLDMGIIRYEWDVSWTLTDAPGSVRETFLINRNGGGSNQFRWTLSNPSGTGDPLMRLNVDGLGFTAINNVTFANDELIMDGLGGNLKLRADFTFGDVAGNNGVTAIDASYSYDGGAFSIVDLGSFTPYTVANLNELRLHSKGALSATEFLDFNSVTVSAIPESSAFLFGGLICSVLGGQQLRKRLRCRK